MGGALILSNIVYLLDKKYNTQISSEKDGRTWKIIFFQIIEQKPIRVGTRIYNFLFE